MKIYIACLASYNAGKLHGRWVDIDGMDEDDIRAEIGIVLADSPEPDADEWAIHDYEGFGHYDVSESEDLSTLADLASLEGELGDDFDAFTAYWNHDYRGDRPDRANFEGAYRGEWPSEERYAEEFFDDIYLHDVPTDVRTYIDYEKFSRDLFMTDCFSVDAPGGGVYIFANN